MTSTGVWGQYKSKSKLLGPCVGPQWAIFLYSTTGDSGEGKTLISQSFVVELTRAVHDIFCVNKGSPVPPHSNHPSPVKSHQGMKQKPLLWGMKAIELSFLSLMEQEGYTRSNGWGRALLQACLVQLEGETKVISTKDTAVSFTSGTHSFSRLNAVFSFIGFVLLYI